MTVADLDALPRREKDLSFYELHHGEVVRVPPPQLDHIEIQKRIFLMLLAFEGKLGNAYTEYPFTMNPDDLRIADVVFVSSERRAAINSRYLACSPELVVEVVSPSNTIMEMVDREAMCLAHGCIEFWTVLPKQKQIRVATKDGIRRYENGDTIACSLFPGWSVSVSSVFAQDSFS